MSNMDLSEALDDLPDSSNNQSGSGTLWPGQANNPLWPDQYPANPVWPRGSSAGGGMFPQPAWPMQPGPAVGPGPGPGTVPFLQKELVVPYKQKLPNGVYDKLLITIAGTVKPHANKIAVDLATSRDLAFHFNPRFNENGKKVIVRNSCISNIWGCEERELTKFPFVEGQPFQLKILCTNSEFKVAVNNEHLFSYQHRIPDLRSINSLSIYKDLTLSRVHVETLG